MPILQAKKTCKEAILPSRKRASDAGWDIHALHDTVLLPARSTIVNTGVIVSAPIGWYITIEGRSSLWSKGIFPNRGIIDSGFTGELIVSLVNTTDSDYIIHAGDRVAQLIVHHHHDSMIEEVETFGPEYVIRGSLGFGSSGR